MNAPARPDESGYPDPRYAWYVVSVLTFAYLLSFLDRQILALMVEPIRRDLDISDTQVSLLGNLAFGIFYTLLGLPLGRAADRFSRRGIIAMGITMWCAMTAACGLARNFVQLFIARVGVGVGEAALNPAALSMISDYFPPRTRGRALTFYNMGISLGVGVALIFGGQVIAWVAGAPPVELPGIGTLRAWQTVFILVGLPGLLVALLMLTIREPERRGRLQIRQADGTVSDQMSVRATVSYLAQRWRTYLTHFVGMTVVTIQGYSFFFWVPSLFVRTWQWTIPEISLAYGLVTIIGGPIGIVLGGWISERLYQRGYKDALMRTCLGGAILLLIPGSVLTPLMPTPELALGMLVLVSVGGAMVTATGAAALQIITPNQMRAQATAVYYFVINIFGLLGPTAVAAVTDYVFAEDTALRWSLAIVCGIASVIGLVALATNLPFYRKSVVEAESWAATASR
ncbi:MAG: MFS transporter [Gammaproteobacteria bacterium]|nr:MFS transporter [Gammaproteobacteria bacterium]